MFRSLRNRLIFSHILPSLVIIPLMGVAILYLLETRLLLPMIYNNLSDDAILIAEVAHTAPEIWQEPASAQIFVTGADPYLSGHLTLTDPKGRVLGSTASNISDLAEEIVELPDLTTVPRGAVIQIQEGPQAEVFTPVVGNNGEYLGVVLLTTRLVTVSEEIFQLRYLLIGVLLLAIFAGIGLGSYLAVSISRPIQRATTAIHTLAQGDFRTRLPESGSQEIRTLTGAVNTLVDRLHGMEQARRQLLANLVHELGRPLGALRSAIHALQKGAGQDEELGADLLDGMDAETGRLQRLLNDLAGLYDQVLGSLELDRQPVDLTIWLPEVLLPWKMDAEEKGLNWQVNIPQQCPLLLADPDRLAQAIGNLCSNAIKFTPKGGDMSVSAGVEQDQLWIQVSDTGPGISPQDQEMIFQPFYRGTQERRIIQGMGLGLTIVKDVILAHGGRIEIVSELGTGSKFTLWLPL
ncbi:MAG: sensor histidine kinase [Anaerolineales bacterium]|jgi:two-component system sensor histidine kinase BaeS